MDDQCPGQEELLDFHLGRLAASRVDAVADHLEKCGVCESAIARLEATEDPLLSVFCSNPFRPIRCGHTPPAASLQNPKARRTGRPCRATRSSAKLGKGGMGVVYQAWQRGRSARSP